MTKNIQSQIDADVPVAASYAMRVECQTDAFIIRAALCDWVYSWKECWHTSEGERMPPDMDVEFELAWNPPSFSELQWLISSIDDCSIAAESLRPSMTYTGNRTSYNELFASMTRPSSETVKKAWMGFERTLRWLPILKHALEGPKHRFAAELGRPAAYMRREAKRLTRFWDDCSAPGAEPISPEDARRRGMATAHLTWLSRPHR